MSEQKQLILDRIRGHLSRKRDNRAREAAARIGIGA